MTYGDEVVKYDCIFQNRSKKHTEFHEALERRQKIVEALKDQQVHLVFPLPQRRADTHSFL